MIETVQAHRHICIVLLLRENLVARYVSSRVAKHTGQWRVALCEAAPPVAIEITPDLCIANLRKIEKQKTQIVSMFRRSNMVTVTYEQLCADPEGVR